VTYQNLTSPSRLDPTKTEAAMAVARMQSATLPMPPVPGTPATGTEIGAMQAWIAAGYPAGSCGVTPGADGGTTDGRAPDGGGPPDPFTGPSVCTSKTTWTGGNRGSASMNPGMACVNCHIAEGEGPIFVVAGTITSPTCATA